MNQQTQQGAAAQSIIRAVRGTAVVKPGDNIDTDRIMPVRYLKELTFEHLGKHVFHDEREAERAAGRVHPFDAPERAQTRVLFANKNFACGSSREHAPQGLHRWGIRAVVAESFSEIFAGNAAAIGLPCAVAEEADVAELQRRAEADPAAEFVLDLEAKTVSCAGFSAPVQMLEGARAQFLDGSWDALAVLRGRQAEAACTAAALTYLRHWR
ncbi:MAG: isopropylmalate isomerase [Candidatus Protistobacter heckmanni]|nr:isopropylmalate isomerase [Candidatus Protistobacter heckmanni]